MVDICSRISLGGLWCLIGLLSIIIVIILSFLLLWILFYNLFFLLYICLCLVSYILFNVDPKSEKSYIILTISVQFNRRLKIHNEPQNFGTKISNIGK